MREVREILLMTDLLQEARERVVRYFGSGVTDIGIDHANRFLDAFEQAIRADAIQQERSRYEGLLAAVDYATAWMLTPAGDEKEARESDLLRTLRESRDVLTPSAPAEKEG